MAPRGSRSAATMHESWVVVFITGSVGMSEQSFTTVGENCRVESEVPRWAHLSRNLTLLAKATSLPLLAGGRSSAWLEPQIVDLVVAGSNPVGHPIFYRVLLGDNRCAWRNWNEWKRASVCRSGRGLQIGFRLFRRIEQRQQQQRRDHGHPGWNEEQLLVIHHVADLKPALQLRPYDAGNERPRAKNKEIEQSLRAGPRVLGKELVHENVNRGEEKGVANAMKNLDEDNQPGLIGEIGVNSKAGRVPQDAENQCFL